MYSIILWISIILLINKPQQISTHREEHKFLDIYTNYPNLDEVLIEEKLSNISRLQRNKEILNLNPRTSNFRANYRPNYIQIQSEKYLDTDDQNQNSRSFQNAETTTNSHVQKISRSSTSSNSKQLEAKNENFFTKINTVIRDQFSRLFKFGGTTEVTTSNPNEGRRQGDEALEKDINSRSGPFIKGKWKFGNHKRFLNIFTILQFENSRCQAQGGGVSYEGTCYSKVECSQQQGASMGPCAKGYGVCCVFKYTCGGTTNQNVSYFECDQTTGVAPTMMPVTQPPTTPPEIDPRLNISAFLSKLQEWSRQSSTGGICLFTVNKRKPEIQQIRIDFLDFDLRGPTNGECQTDRLVITGGNSNNRIPVICGYNTGQQLYVDVSDVPGPIQLSISTANPSEKKFRLRISQIRGPCANFMNCLQYYTGATGTIQTFNYDPSPRGFGQGQYFNNLNYAICIKKEPGYCSITYTNVQNGVESPFRLTNLDANGNMLIPPGQAGAEIFNCPDDYIIINGVRLCGDKLNDGSTNPDFRVNAPVTDISGGPFILPVRTNNRTVARGIKLFYRQNRCTI